MIEKLATDRPDAVRCEIKTFGHLRLTQCIQWVIRIHIRYDQIGTPNPGRLGYARVSTYGQTLDAQLDQLRRDGTYRRSYREKVSGVPADPAAVAPVPKRPHPRRRGDGDEDRPPRPLNLRPVRNRQADRGC